MKLINKSLLAAMVLIMGVSGAFAASDYFKDVPTDHWATESVEWAKANKIVEGYEDGTFQGDRELSRYEMTTMLHNYDQWGLAELKREVAQLESQVNDLQIEAGTRKFGVIRGINEGENGKITIDLDEMQWFTGLHAKQAMLEDGECKELPECYTPNGYYIRNTDPNTITLNSVQNANFTLLDGSSTKQVDLETFEAEVMSDNFQKYPLPFWLEDRGDGIYDPVSIQYLP